MWALFALLAAQVPRLSLTGEASVSLTFATPSSIRVGETFAVEVQGGGFDTKNDKMMLIGPGRSCGDADNMPPHSDGLNSAAEYQSIMCDGPGSAATKLICRGLTVFQAGQWTVCVCDADALVHPRSSQLAGNATGTSSANDTEPVAAGSTFTSTTTFTQTLTMRPCNEADRFWLGSDKKGFVNIDGIRYSTDKVEWRAGTAETLRLSGTRLSSRDRIRIVDEFTNCFDPTQSKAMHPAVSSDESRYIYPDGMRNGPSSETQETWEAIAVLVPGTYQVCWCAAGVGGCDSDDDFTAHAATIAVTGPTPGSIQDSKCITGVICTLVIEGTGLTDHDRIQVIEDHHECGWASLTSAVIRGVEGERTTGSDTVSRFGGVRMGRPGNYRVCWCGSYDPALNPRGCIDPQDFNVFIGNLSVGGPQQATVFRPGLGVPFDYFIRGWGLSDVDRVSFVDAKTRCGSPEANVHAESIEPVTVPKGPPTVVEGPTSTNRTAVGWTHIVVREMNELRVCWCAHFFGGCTEGAHFALDIGVINPIGAQNATYIEAVTGRPFSLEVFAAGSSLLGPYDRIRIVNQGLSRGICGYFGTSEHSPAVSETSCWPRCVESPVWGPPEVRTGNKSEFWDPVLIMERGVYDICWCNAGSGGCDSDEDFVFKVGEVTVNGVTTGNTIFCAAYNRDEQCFVTLPLTDGLSIDDDMLQLSLAAPGAKCGIAERAPATAFTMGTRVPANRGPVTGGQQTITFNLGTPQAPGVYMACYCQGPTCSTSTVQEREFFQKAGVVTVMGLQDNDLYHKCYLRSNCRLNLKGAGLAREDALMLISPLQSCGEQGSPVSFTTDGPEFRLDSGDRIFLGNLEATTSEGVGSWSFDLGHPIRIGRHRMCYCSAQKTYSGMCEYRSDFDQPAGHLFTRGSEFSVEAICEQGEACKITARGREWNENDRIILLKDGPNHTCGMENNGEYPAWMMPTKPKNVADDVIPDLLAATFVLSSVREPGRYRVCYCADIFGGQPCLTAGQDVRVDQYPHELVTLRVTGSLLAVREVGDSPGGETSRLPASRHAVSVEVDTLMRFTRYTCVATGRAAPEGFLPRKSDLENCTKDVLELSERQKLFPRCWGIGEMLDPVMEMGPNMVHIPTFMTEAAVKSTVNLHVWCFGKDLCSNDRCVMPANNVGLAVPLTGGLIDTNSVWSATVGTSFALRMRIASDFNVGQEWPRIKILDDEDSECSTNSLSTAVQGLTCPRNVGVGKCQPAPSATLSAVSWGAGRELVWENLAVGRVGTFGVCYCDRHYGETCVAWVHAGKLQVKGPDRAGQLRFTSNPGKAFQLVVEGSGLVTADRLRIIPQGVSCTAAMDGFDAVATTTEGATAASTGSAVAVNPNEDARLFEWYSGSAAFANGTHERWDVLVEPGGYFTVCWCGGSDRSCNALSDFTTRLGILHVTPKQDCEITDWWVVKECDRPCGGGKATSRRHIQKPASGGGEPCPNEDDLYKVEDCNVKPCPLARLDRAWTEPSALKAGVAFQLYIEGEWLDPEEDRIVLIDEDKTCGSTQVHHGGAACNQFNAFDRLLACGNGASSIRVQHPGRYKVCVCDASGALVRNSDGSGTVQTGSMEGVGLQGAGCATPDLYLNQPAEGAILEVGLAPAVAAADDPPVEALSEGVIVGIVALVLVLIIGIAVFIAFYLRKRMHDKAQQKVMDEAQAAEQAQKDKQMQMSGIDPQMLQYYDAYYQSLGYPQGTATQIFGAAGAQQAQLALPAPMLPGAPPPMHPGSANLALTNGPAAWDAVQHAPRPPAAPLSLPPPRPPGSMAPPPVNIAGRSPRGIDGRSPRAADGGRSPRGSSFDGRSPRASDGKSFGDLVSETNRRPSMQLPLFTDTALPAMPTPTATPRDVVTPRTEALALEDGNAESSDSGEEDTAKQPRQGDRPLTADSALSDNSLALSESTIFSSPGPSRPGTGGSRPSTGDSNSASPFDGQDAGSGSRGGVGAGVGSHLFPVLEEREDEDAPGTQTTPRSFRSLFNNKVSKLLSGGDQGSSPTPPTPPTPVASAPQPPMPPEPLPVTPKRADEEKVAAENAAAERAEAERAAAEAAAKAKEAAEKAAADKAAAEKAEAERIAAEKAAAEKTVKEAAEREAAERAERERLEAEKAAAEQTAKEAAEREAAERAERERLEAEKAAAEKTAKEAAEREAAERAERERLEAEKAAAEKAAKEAAEREAAERAERERLEAEKAAAEKAAREAAEIEAAKVAAEKAAAEKAAREAAEKEAADEVAASEKAKTSKPRGMASLISESLLNATKEGSMPPQPPAGIAWDAPPTPKLGSNDNAPQPPKPPEPEVKEEPAEESRPVTPPVGRKPPPPPPSKAKTQTQGEGCEEDALDPSFGAWSTGSSKAPTLRELAESSAASLRGPGSGLPPPSPSGSSGRKPPPPPPRKKPGNLTVESDGSEGGNSPAGSASGSERPAPPPPGRPPRDPSPSTHAVPGPSLSDDVDLEDTLQSNYSLMSGNSGSPSGTRKKISLGSMARTSANVVEADKKAGKTAKVETSKPIRANVPTRAALQAIERVDSPSASGQPPPPHLPPSPHPVPPQSPAGSKSLAPF